MWPETLESSVLSLLHRRGRLTRSELHELTGVRPNTIGETVKAMLDKALICEGELEALGPGRPRASLRIDDAPWRVVGLGIDRKEVSVCRMTPRGDAAARQLTQPCETGSDIVKQAETLLRQAVDDQVLAIGVSVPGFADPQHRSLLLSSAAPGRRSVDLTPIYDAAGGCPIVLENDMHAVAARWILTNDTSADQDILLVSLGDGAIGCAMLIDGKPNRGCVVGGNELGHMRFAVPTDRCHCGHVGCLARIFSTEFLRRHGDSDATLAERAARFDGSDEGLRVVLDHAATGLSNITNFVRPTRVVLISDLASCPLFERTLEDLTYRKLLPDIAARVEFELWNQPLASTAVNAGWLALAALYFQDWRHESLPTTPGSGSTRPLRRRPRRAAASSVSQGVSTSG